MEWLRGTLAEAVKLAAARAVLAREKRATNPELLAGAEAGRRTLGLLGHPEDQLNDLASRYRAGDVSRLGATARFHAQRPSAVRKLVNTPASVGTALREGDVTGALNQADVLGLKNLDPTSTPVTALTAAGLGGAGYHVANQVQQNNRLRDLLKGNIEGDPLAKNLSDTQKITLDEYRKGVPSELQTRDARAARVKQVGTDVRDAYSKGDVFRAAGAAKDHAVAGAKNLKGWLASAYRGPEDVAGAGARKLTTEITPSKKNPLMVEVAGAPGTPPTHVPIAGPGGKTPSKVKVTHTVRGEAIPRRVVEQTRNQMKALDPTGSRLGRLVRSPAGVGLGLASIPLLAREWMSPTGYRSGANPFSKVLDANQPKSKKD